MSNPYELFGTNTNLESVKGVTLEYPGFSIIIHRAGGSNKKFAKILSEKMKPHRQRFERGILDDETSNKIMVETYAEAVVIGWKDVKGRDGKKIPFNVENVVKLFNDLPELFADVKRQANDASVFRQENEKVEQKN